MRGVGNVRSKKKWFFRVIILLAVIAAVGWLWLNGFLGGGSALAREIFLKNRVNVLLVGADQRPGEVKFNTDSIILVSIDPKTEQISLLSIPRDTRVALTGRGYVKINAIAALKDLPTLQKSVEQLTGVSIAGYVQTNFGGFKKIIDTLGGITVDVEKDMYYETGDSEDGYIDLHKGLQRLDGSQALQYARFRNDALADISRTVRQQVVLKAVAQEMLRVGTLPKIPLLVPQLMETVNTNLTTQDGLAVAKLAIGFDSENVISQTLPGTFQNIDGISYWQVDPAAVKKVVQNLFQGITTDEVIDQQRVDLLQPAPAAPGKELPKVPGIGQDAQEEALSKSVPLPIDEMPPQVPGNRQDPNGQASSVYQDFSSE